MWFKIFPTKLAKFRSRTKFHATTNSHVLKYRFILLNKEQWQKKHQEKLIAKEIKTKNIFKTSIEA